MPDREWWQDFFELPDCLELGAFPTARETQWEVEGLLRLLKPAPSDLILDACCGHGRHALLLAAAGLRVVGLDRSLRLLGRAQRARRRRGLRCPFVRADLRQMPFRGEFTIVLNLFNSFGYLERPEDDRRALAEMARCLRPGGRLLMETRNKRFQCAAVPFARSVRLGDGGRAWVECDYDPVSRQLRSRWTRLGPPEALYAESAIRPYSPEEFVELFEAAGLEVLHLFGDYDQSPFRGLEHKLLILARKAPEACHAPEP
jgi:SAM-dependent methyltransferase